MKKFLLFFATLFAVTFAHADNDGLLKAIKGEGTVMNSRSGSFSFGKETTRPIMRKANNLEVVNEKAKAPVVMKAGDGTTIYGELCYTSLWEVDEDGVLDWGVYSFPASANTSVTPHYTHTSIQANGGGAYHNGKLYFTSYYEGPVDLLYLYFCVLNVETWEMEQQIALATDTYSSIALDMTYDPISRQLYSQSYVDETGNDYTLSIIDTNTGKATTVAALPRMSFIACDITGQMYGVRYSDGMFCKIDKTNGSVTTVGSTGVSPKYIGTGTFDSQTGKLYWTTTSAITDQSGLYEIDINTGSASLISLFPNEEMFTCMYIPRPENEYRLGDIQAFSANFAQNTTGTISVTAPSTDAQGNAIDGNVTVVVYDNGKLLFSLPAAPGATVSKEVTLTEGVHQLEAMATHATVGKSTSKQLSVFIGTDGPAAVGNLTLTKGENNLATLTWDTPSTGAHGGEIKPNLLYYNIYRMPENKLVGEDIDGNTWSETITKELYREYSYKVVGYYKGVQGDSIVSNEVAFGTPFEVPYTLGFDDFNSLLDCIIYNNNDDSGYWGWYQSTQCAAYRYDTFNDADDWLVIPAVKLEAGKTYKLKYKAASYGGFLYPESMEVKIGKGQDIEDFTATLVENKQYPHDQLQEYEAVIENINETGAYFIAFHATTTRGEYFLFVDDVQILNGPSADAPGLVEELVITPAPNAALATNISFKAPSKTFSGSDLSEITSINIYRENELIKSFGATTPGAALSFEDTGAKQGLNNYKIVAANSIGEGNPAEVSCWAGIDVAVAPTDAVHTTTDGINAVISWTAPAQGVNGGSIDYSKLTYTITRNDNVVVATGVTATTYTDTTIDTTDGQKNVFYNIAAVNAAGTSAQAKTHFLVYGAPYSGEYHESFKNGAVETRPWVIEIVKESINPSIPAWQIVTKGENPVIDAQDGDNGLVTFTRNTPWASSRIISPKLTAGDIKNPVLTFWMYHYYNPLDIWSTDQDIMQPEVLIDGKYTNLTEKPILLINGKGWYKYEIMLSELVGDKTFQVAFCGTSGSGYNIHLDNIALVDVLDNDMDITAFEVCERLAVGTSRNIEVVVRNHGAQPVSSYKVVLYRNGEAWKEVAGNKTLAFGDEETISFEISATVADAGSNQTYYAEVVYDADQDKTNNTTESKSVMIPDAGLPAVTSLVAAETLNGIELSWEEPASASENGTVTESFENMEAFTITDFGDWTLADIDALETYGISNSSTESGIYEYPNAGSQMAFQVLNPGKAGITGKAWIPFSGNQMAVSFASVGGQNNDWLISPEVEGGQTVSFYAKSASVYYGEESFYFCYSATDSAVTSFKPVTNIQYAPYDKWGKFSFTLPEDARFFAINYVSTELYALLIDDIEYISKNPMLLELQGFNVYRNDQLLNNQIVEDLVYTDNNGITAGETYTYRVSTIYDKGESALSNPVTVIASTGIESMEYLPIIFVEGNTLYIKNAADQHIAVNNVNGISYYNGNIDSDFFSMSLQQGIYAVSVNGVTSKIVIR